VLRDDVAESRKGVQDSPVKAALEVLRQIRPLLPTVVDFGGLLPDSHRDFLSRFEPLSYLLSAGPPDEHVEQVVALIEAGVVEVVGPMAEFRADDQSGRYVVSSPRVAGSARLADLFVEARVPAGDIRRTASPLLRQMAADGMVSQYVNVDPVSGTRFVTGGLAVTPGPPFHVIDGQGRPDPDIYAIGVAADRTRWFTQVGTGRPGKDSPFRRDADAIAVDALGIGLAEFEVAGADRSDQVVGGVYQA
jgi:methylaspartate mutase epsilon subunit